MIDFLLLFRVEITQIKSHIEVFLGFLSIVLVFTGRLAPIFPIFFWQYLRIKHVVSSFTQLSFQALDTQLLRRFLPGFIYNTVILFVKNKLSHFVDYSKSKDNEAAALAAKKTTTD